MFDVGFAELLVIGVVALIVIGPDQLPKVARFLGTMFGKFQRYLSSVKEEMDREMRMEQLKELQNSMLDANRQPEKKSTTAKIQSKKTQRTPRKQADN